MSELSDLTIKAAKEGTELPPHPEYGEIIMMARELINPQPQQQPMEGNADGNSNTN